MAILQDGVNAPSSAIPQANGSMGDDPGPAAGPPVDAGTIELVAQLTVDAVLTRVREGVMDAEAVVAAERRGKQRAGVLAPLT